MQNYECKECHCICDPGELVGGTCIECREKEQVRMLSEEKISRMLASPFKQMEFGSEVENDAV